MEAGNYPLTVSPSLALQQQQHSNNSNNSNNNSVCTTTSQAPSTTTSLSNDSSSLFLLGSPRFINNNSLDNNYNHDYNSRAFFISAGNQFIDEQVLKQNLSDYGDLEHFYLTETDNVFYASYRTSDSLLNLLNRVSSQTESNKLSSSSTSSSNAVILNGLRIHLFQSNNISSSSSTAAGNNNLGNNNNPLNLTESIGFIDYRNNIPQQSIAVGGGGGGNVANDKSRIIMDHGFVNNSPTVGYANINNNNNSCSSNNSKGVPIVSSRHSSSTAANIVHTSPIYLTNKGFPLGAMPDYRIPTAAAAYYTNPNNSHHSHFHLQPTTSQQQQQHHQQQAQQQAQHGLIKDNYPTRILINNDLIGAIIGRSGEKIKEITLSTGARVDVKREIVAWSQYTGQSHNNNSTIGLFNAKDPNSQPIVESQIVFIYGNTDNASMAVKRIMEICMNEAERAGVTEKPHLGLLSEDRFCGRIIGREGKNLNNLREETGATLFVANTPIVTQLQAYPNPCFIVDRIIDIRGSLDSMCNAETQISAKLRQFYRQDFNRMPFGPSNLTTTASTSSVSAAVAAVAAASHHQHQQQQQQHWHDLVMASLASSPYNGGGPSGGILPSTATGAGGPSTGNCAAYPSAFGALCANVGGSLASSSPHCIAAATYSQTNSSPPACIVQRVLGDNFQLDEALYMRIPHVSAGAVIGTDGSSIKKIMEDTKTIVSVSKVDLLTTHQQDNNKPDDGVMVDNNKEKSIENMTSVAQRKVIIKGSSANQMRAQWHIFQRVKNSSRPGDWVNNAIYSTTSGSSALSDSDLCLWTIIRVPRALVGRLIGKGGRTVYNIQSSTATIIHLPKSINSTIAVGASLPQTPFLPPPPVEDFNHEIHKEGSNHHHHHHHPHHPNTIDPSLYQDVEIFGTFENTQLALGRIRALVNHALTQLYNQGQNLCNKLDEITLNESNNTSSSAAREGENLNKNVVAAVVTDDDDAATAAADDVLPAVAAAVVL